MYRKNIITSLLLTAIFLVGSVAVFAQTAPVRGRVMLQKGDGTSTPVADAVVDAYRTDVTKGKMSPSKTDKKGYFSFAGFPLGQTFALVVSAPGIKSEIFPNVKGGAEGITITVFEGDGKSWSEEEVRKALTSGASVQQTGELTAEQKKQMADEQKKRDEIMAKNKKIEESTAVIKVALDEGSKAYEAKNYDLAIIKFTEGINADPDFEGSATVLNNNAALAYRMRAFDFYKKGTADPANKASFLEKAKEDFHSSEANSRRTVELIEKISDPVEAKKYEQAKYQALLNLVEVHRLMVATGADTSQSEEAVEILDKYLLLETDPAKKIKNQTYVADALRLSGKTALAIPIYRKILESEASNYDVIGSLGLSLFAEGVGAANKEQMQEGLNFMQLFSDSAPDKPGDNAYMNLKQSIKDAVVYLKTQEKLTPQKTTTKTTNTKKRN